MTKWDLSKKETLKYIIINKNTKNIKTFWGGGELLADFRFSRGVSERNPREKRRIDCHYFDSTMQVCTVSPAARRLDYTLNVGGGEVAGQARRFIVTGNQLSAESYTRKFDMC